MLFSCQTSLARLPGTPRICGEHRCSRFNVNQITVGIQLQTVDLGLSGGADRDRTGDLMLAKHALSQLSYSP